MAITKTTETYNYETKAYDKSTVTFAEGCVLEVYWKSVETMSECWESALHAKYWDDDLQCVKTDFWLSDAKVDVTDEVKEKVRRWVYKNAYDKALEMATEDAAEKRKGSVVKVVKGRADKGAVGKIVAIIERPYKMGYRSTMAKKYGIATSDIMIKVPAANGKVYDNHRDMVWAWAFNTELAETPEINMASVKEHADELYQSRLRYDWKSVA